MTDNPLQAELAFYDKHKDEYRGHHLGKFVLIKGDEFAGAFDTLEAAYEEGLKRYGNVPMLIKQVLDTDRAQTLPALTHGLIIARP